MTIGKECIFDLYECSIWITNRKNEIHETTWNKMLGKALSGSDLLDEVRIDGWGRVMSKDSENGLVSYGGWVTCIKQAV